MKSAVSSSCTFLHLVFLLTVFSLLLPGCARQETPSYSGPPTKITIGIYKGESTAILYAADHLGYLSQMGIAAELQEFDSGAAAVAALNEGRVDLATASDFVFVSNIQKHKDLRIVTTINKEYSVYIVARNDKGISKPDDLNKKRIAVKKTSIGEYYLGKYLSSKRMALSDVTTVNMEPAMMEKEITVGGIDAAIIWNPVARRMRNSLGSHAVYWPAQTESNWHMLLIAQESFLNKESVAMSRLMKALIMAEKSIETDPAAIQRYLSKRLGMPEKYFAEIWADNLFKVSLGRSLMLSLEEQSRWIGSSQGVALMRQPNFLNYLDFKPLETVRPESVTIIH